MNEERPTIGDPPKLATSNDGPIGQTGGIGEGLLSSLIDLLPDYFFIADSEMKLVYVNQTAAEYFGVPKDRIVGKRFVDVEPDSDFANRFAEHARQIMTTDQPYVGDFGPYNEPDGTQSHFRCHFLPFRHPQTGEQMVLGLVQDITDRVERERHARELAVMNREMQIAREIQQSVYPSALQNDWLELEGASEPAAYAGGDFYDWQQLADGSVVMALGDVTGHGVGPALVAAECRAYWRVLAAALPLRAAVLRLNELLVESLQGNRFVTFAAARLSSDGRVEVFSAGQGPLVLRRKEGGMEMLSSHTIPLGISLDPSLADEVTVRSLRAGDALLFASDGLTEARNTRDQQWTTAGLMDCLTLNPHLYSGALLRTVQEANIAFADGTPAADDQTLIVATYKGAS